jgi:hypothetical protein
MVNLSLEQVDAFSHEVVDAIGKFVSVIVYYSPHHGVFRYGPPNGAAAERATEENRMVGLYENGADATEIYTDCMWYLSQHGIQIK